MEIDEHWGRNTRIVAEHVRHLKIETRQAGRIQAEHGALDKSLEFPSFVRQPARECRGLSHASTRTTDQATLERNGLAETVIGCAEVEGVLVPAAVDRRVLVDVGEDDRIVTNPGAHADDRQRVVPDRTHRERDVFPRYAVNRSRTAGSEVEIQFVIDRSEVQQEGHVILVHFRSVNIELTLQISGNDIDEGNRLDDGECIAAPAPVVVAEHKRVRPAAEFDVFEALKVFTGSNDRVRILYGEFEVGRDNFIFVIQRAIRRHCDLQAIRRERESACFYYLDAEASYI